MQKVGDTTLNCICYVAAKTWMLQKASSSCQMTDVNNVPVQSRPQNTDSNFYLLTWQPNLISPCTKSTLCLMLSVNTWDHYWTHPGIIVYVQLLQSIFSKYKSDYNMCDVDDEPTEDCHPSAGILSSLVKSLSQSKQNVDIWLITWAKKSCRIICWFHFWGFATFLCHLW